MLVEYTWGGQVAKVTPTRWSHTPAVGKLLMDTPTCWSHTPAVGKLLKVWAYTLIAYTCGGQMAGGLFQLLPRGPSPTPWSLWSAFMLLVWSNKPKSGQNALFSDFRA